MERLNEVTATGPRTPVADRSIGRILLDAGKLKAGDAERAMRLAKDKGLRFGEACVELKLVTQADIDTALSYQFDYPYLRAGESRLSEELVAAYQPFSDEVEALRALRTQLLLRWFSPERRALAICSPSRGDGRSYLAANLAIVFSQLGERTLLIDADMRDARQHRLFNLSNQFGLSAMLTGRMSGAAIEHVGHFRNLCVISAGATPPNPLELVSRPEFKELLENESQTFEVVLIDTPAAETSADAQAIAARAGGALIVARENKSRLEALGRLVGAIRSASAQVIGCVLNRV
ncbi:MAG: chain length determinant protein tyrosine kinase EpsG [Burkholderiales bacterium]|nr:chain length determinant protein tyrosine kinase EpsG [Burkholderiales bacterium]